MNNDENTTKETAIKPDKVKIQQQPTAENTTTQQAEAAQQQQQ